MSRRSNIKEGRHVGLDFYDLLIDRRTLPTLPFGDATSELRLAASENVPTDKSTGFCEWRQAPGSANGNIVSPIQKTSALKAQLRAQRIG
jgi:hypothetical protein